MQGRGLRAVLLAGLACAQHAGAQAEPHWVRVDAGPSQMQYLIDAESVRRQGPIVHYQVVGRGIQPATRGTTFQAEVGVDCTRRMRVEYVATTRWTGGVRTGTDSEMRSVFDGTRQAAELDKACQLATPAGPDHAEASASPLTSHSATSSPHPPVPDAPRWTGTAFAVGSDLAITNDHVVRSCSRLELAQDGATHRARVVARDAAADLAAVSIQAPRLRPIPVSSAEHELGERVIVLGYPLANVLGSDLRVSTGIVSALSGPAGDRSSIQISAPIQPGNSGGPVLSRQADVIGVVTRKLDVRFNGENVGFAVRAGQLQRFLAQHRLAYEKSAARPGAPLQVVQVVRKAGASVAMLLCF